MDVNISGLKTLLRKEGNLNEIEKETEKKARKTTIGSYPPENCIASLRAGLEKETGFAEESLLLLVYWCIISGIS